jgi:hypothetical protein
LHKIGNSGENQSVKKSIWEKGEFRLKNGFYGLLSGYLSLLAAQRGPPTF